MKTVLVECIFRIEVPWDEKWGSPYFQIEENSCPGTNVVDRVLSELMEAAEEESVCWACNLQGKNKIIAIEDREPVNYVDRIKSITVKPILKQIGC